mgnify:CR=1 FL=1
MRIVNSESFSRSEHIQKKEMVSFIMRLIFSVSEVTKSFSNAKKLQEQRKSILKAKVKLSKQNELLDKISLLKGSLKKKSSFLKDENSNTRSKLLIRMRVEE